MHISSIAITGLFDVFDYQIRLRLSERITIIHGPNGCGKTTVLKLLHGLLTKNFRPFLNTPFTTFTVTFEDSSTLDITKEKAAPSEVINNQHLNQEKNEWDLRFKYNSQNQGAQEFLLSETEYFSPDILAREIERTSPFIRQLGEDLYQDMQDDEVLTSEELVQRYGDRTISSLNERVRIGKRIISRSNKPRPDWLYNILAKIPCYLIGAHRLFSTGKKPGDERLAVSAFALELAKEIATKISEYAELSQKLDRALPFRLLRELPPERVDADTIRKKYQEQTKTRERLIRAGLLEKDELGEGAIELVEIPGEKLQVLWIYLSDIDKKYNAFEELLQKIELFARIIESKRFLHKTLIPSKIDGFSFITPSGKKLKPADLSSGEQHELILTYHLLFKAKENSLILIDEPELSLHIVWQQAFLNDMQEIAKLAKLEFLIATHSPQIVHGRRMLMEQLGDI